MFYWLTGRRGRTTSPRARLCLEWLETRDCPAAPVITAFAVEQMGQHNVGLSGTVQDENPGTVVVHFTGVATGNVTVSSNGSFWFETTASSLGTVNAKALDAESLWSAEVPAQLTNSAPAILDFTATHLTGTWWSFRGRVTDEYFWGLTVKLTGLASLGSGVDAYVDADGWFVKDVQLGPGEEGTVVANCTDWWNAAAEEVGTIIRY